MAYMTRGQLYYNDYDWKAKEEHDDPNFRGYPDSAELARREGYEVLGFINQFAKLNSWKQDNAAAGNKVERMIRTGLPGTIRARKKVHAWIVDNWSSYS